MPLERQALEVLFIKPTLFNKADVTVSSTTESSGLTTIIMSKTTIGGIVVVILALVLGVFYYFAPDSWKFWQGGQTANVIDSTIDTSKPHETITAKHQYKNGTHIVAGEVDLPTPCYVLSTDTLIAESFPEQVTIRFKAETSGEFCAQVVTTERFKVEFQ